MFFGFSTESGLNETRLEVIPKVHSRNQAGQRHNVSKQLRGSIWHHHIWPVTVEIFTLRRLFITPASVPDPPPPPPLPPPIPRKNFSCVFRLTKSRERKMPEIMAMQSRSTPFHGNWEDFTGPVLTPNRLDCTFSSQDFINFT